MRFDAETCSQRLIWVFLLAWFQTSCTEDATGRDCRHVRQEIIVFTEKNILPLVDSEIRPKIDLSMVEQLKRLREEVLTCDKPDVRSSATDWTDWDEVNFIRLYSWLSRIEVHLQLAAEEDNPETTEVLINTRTFENMVIDLEEALRRER